MADNEGSIMVYWNYRKGDFVTFNTAQSDLAHLNGKTFEILDRLTEDEADLWDVGPMYRIGIDGHTVRRERVTIEAFEDELTLTDESKFERMVDTYRALGYRMVSFEKYDGETNKGGWLMAFNTHGKPATDFPISAFDNDAVRRWCAFCGWNLYDSDIRVYDDTDEVAFMLGSYDFTARFPVFELTKED